MTAERRGRPHSYIPVESEGDVTIYRTPAGQRHIREWCEQRIAAWGHRHETLTIPTSLGVTRVLVTGSGPNLVLLAGTNFASATWLDLIAALSTSHTVHAVDLPGQPGLSAPQRPRSATRRYGAWLAQVMRALGGSPATLVGHSLGAAAAMSGVAAGAPAARLVLLDPAGLMRLRVSVAVLRPTLPWLRTPDESTAAGLLRMMMAPHATPDAHLVAWMALVGRHVRTSLAPSPLPSAMLTRLVAVPVSVLSGRSDAFLPPARLGRAVTRRLGHATFEAIDGAGHLLPHERPDVVVDHVRSTADPPVSR